MEEVTDILSSPLQEQQSILQLRNPKLLPSIDANYPPLTTAKPIPLVTVGTQGVTSAAIHCQGGTARITTVSKPDGMLPGLAL